MIIPLTPPSLIYVVFRQRAAIIGFLLLGLIVTIAYCVLARPLYEADASLVVNFSRQPSQTPGTDQPTTATPTDHDEIINSYLLIVQGNALAEQVISEIGLAEMYPQFGAGTPVSRVVGMITGWLGPSQTPMQRAVYRFVTKDLSVQVIKDSNVIQLALYNADAEVAKRALALLIDRFLGQQARIGRDPQLAFVQTQVEHYRQQVAEAQAAMEAFQLQNGISSMDEETSYFIKQRSDLVQQLSTNQVRVEEDQRKIDTLGKQIGTLHDVVDLRQEDRDPALDAARTQLVTLQIKDQTLRSSYRPDSDVVRDVEAQIAKVQGLVTTLSNRDYLRTSAPNPTFQVIQSAYLQAQADLDAATQAQPVLQQQIDQISGELAERSKQQAKYQDLVREYQIDDENYRAYLQGVQQARIADDLNKQKITTIAIFDPAVVPSDLPAYPRKGLVIGLGLVLGLIFGVSAAFMLESWDEKVNTPYQVNSVLGLPLLGSMATFSRPGTQGRGART
jgi:uncharacterized protein involved in exopolysaccharide biosynthesis